MKQAWEDLKSFVTIAMIVLLFVIVIANLFGNNISISNKFGNSGIYILF